MPRKRLPVRKIQEVLRLRAAGMNPRMIAASIGAGKTTVYEYLARADAAGVSWPLPAGLDGAALEAKLFPEASAEAAARRPVPDWHRIHAELKGGRHVTLRLLWLEWRGGNPEAWGYSLGLQPVLRQLPGVARRPGRGDAPLPAGRGR